MRYIGVFLCALHHRPCSKSIVIRCGVIQYRRKCHSSTDRYNSVFGERCRRSYVAINASRAAGCSVYKVCFEAPTPPFFRRPTYNSIGDDGEGTAGPKFGHLHVVFRDWNYSGTADEVSEVQYQLASCLVTRRGGTLRIGNFPPVCPATTIPVVDFPPCPGSLGLRGVRHTDRPSCCSLSYSPLPFHDGAFFVFCSPRCRILAGRFCFLFSRRTIARRPWREPNLPSPLAFVHSRYGAPSEHVHIFTSGMCNLMCLCLFGAR